ncbi:MAG: hypothetical protein MR292_10165 [Alistipes sp.]|nr:hypothetical protein [Alistipes sp.]
MVKILFSKTFGLFFAKFFEMPVSESCRHYVVLVPAQRHNMSDCHVYMLWRCGRHKAFGGVACGFVEIGGRIRMRGVGYAAGWRTVMTVLGPVGAARRRFYEKKVMKIPKKCLWYNRFE